MGSTDSAHARATAADAQLNELSRCLCQHFSADRKEEKGFSNDVYSLISQNLCEEDVCLCALLLTGLALSSERVRLEAHKNYTQKCSLYST